MKFIKKFKSFESKEDIVLNYYCFDIDDNLVHMNTVIHMDHFIDGKWIPEDVSTSEFAKVRSDKENWRIKNNSPDEAFSEFRDIGPRGPNAFLDDFKSSISEGKYGPSWDAFIKCLISGSIFSLNTARGHSPSTLRKMVEYVLDNLLTDDQQFEMYANCMKFAYLFDANEEYNRIPKGVFSKSKLIKDYLSHCEFFGVSSPEFIKRFKLGDAANPEHAKGIALDYFIEKCNEYGKKIGSQNIRLGMSDDDKKTIDHLHKFFNEKASLYTAMKFYLFQTTDRDIKGGIKIKF
jgi:hypothetical protein